MFQNPFFLVIIHQNIEQIQYTSPLPMIADQQDHYHSSDQQSTQDVSDTQYFTTYSNKLDSTMDETINYLTFKNRASLKKSPAMLQSSMSSSLQTGVTLISSSAPAQTSTLMGPCSSRRVGPYSCNMCGKLYKYLSDIKRHMKSECINCPRKYACPHCNKAYFRPNHLKTHLLTHTKVMAANEFAGA